MTTIEHPAAEREIADRLAALPAVWHVLDALPAGSRGPDIDHVVIGPPGVFTITTKHRPQSRVWVRADTFKVNGHDEDWIADSRLAARRTARLLSGSLGRDIAVQGVIAVVGAQGGFAVKEQPLDGAVKVVTARTLTMYLHSLPIVLDVATRERVYELAARA